MEREATIFSCYPDPSPKFLRANRVSRVKEQWISLLPDIMDIRSWHDAKARPPLQADVVNTPHSPHTFPGWRVGFWTDDVYRLFTLGFRKGLRISWLRSNCLSHAHILHEQAKQNAISKNLIQPTPRTASDSPSAITSLTHEDKSVHPTSKHPLIL